MSKQIDMPVLAIHTVPSRPRVPELGNVSDLASAQTIQDARCDASPVTCGKRGRTNLLVLLVALDASPLSLRRDFWRGMGGGAITLFMASAAISIRMETAIYFASVLNRRGYGLRRNASSHSASSGLTVRTKAPC